MVVCWSLIIRYTNDNEKPVTDKNKDSDLDTGTKENNWIQTIPGKGWFIILRMYGPLQPWIDKTWRPGEIEVMK